MRRERQNELFDRIVSHLDSGTDPMSEAVMEQPADAYVRGDRFRREQEAVFDRFPVIVGMSDLVRNPGDFFTDDITGRALLVVRGRDGRLRAFHNVCAHRAARVESRAHGCSKRFACPYHSWTYDDLGRLRGIPNDEGFAGIDRSARGLVPVPVEERHGMVWALPAAAPGDPIDVAGFLGPRLDEELAEFGMQDHVHDRTEILREPFNWKIVVDGFLETYHLRFLHRNTIGPYITSNFALCDDYGRHGRMVGLRASFAEARHEPAERRDLLRHIAIIYRIFPNTIFVWQGDHFETWTSFPDRGADAMAARASLLVPPELARPELDERWEKNWRILMDTVKQEDFAVAREIHRNSRSGSRPRALFGRQEAALQHFHRALERELAAAAA